MPLHQFIRYIQYCAMIIIFIGSLIGFSLEIYKMINQMSVSLADLLLLFIYVEVMGMIRIYLLEDEIRITYPIIIAITAISRLIILQKKDIEPSTLIYESLAILILGIAIIILRLRYLKILEPKKHQK